MKSTKLTIDKCKIDKLQNQKKIMGGRFDGETTDLPKCKEGSEVWEIERFN